MGTDSGNDPPLTKAGNFILFFKVKIPEKEERGR